MPIMDQTELMGKNLSHNTYKQNLEKNPKAENDDLEDSNTEYPRTLWYNCKRYNICIIGMPEKERRNRRKYLKQINVSTDLGSSKYSKQDNYIKKNLHLGILYLNYRK